jgi:hypothetical protein
MLYVQQAESAVLAGFASFCIEGWFIATTPTEPSDFHASCMTRVCNPQLQIALGFLRASLLELIPNLFLEILASRMIRQGKPILIYLLIFARVPMALVTFDGSRHKSHAASLTSFLTDQAGMLIPAIGTNCILFDSLALLRFVMDSVSF